MENSQRGIWKSNETTITGQLKIPAGKYIKNNIQ
jgi:hypothetical protein